MAGLSCDFVLFTVPCTSGLLREITALRSAKDLKNFAILATDGGLGTVALQTEDQHWGRVDVNRDAINISPAWPHWRRRFTPALGVMAALLCCRSAVEDPDMGLCRNP